MVVREVRGKYAVLELEARNVLFSQGSAFTQQNFLTEEKGHEPSLLENCPDGLVSSFCCHSPRIEPAQLRSRFNACMSTLEEAIVTDNLPVLLVAVIKGEAGDQALSQLKTHLPSVEKRLEVHEEESASTTSILDCSSIINASLETEVKKTQEHGAICCDRSHYRSDICYMKGDIRTSSQSSSIILYNSAHQQEGETIRPYTRKWEEETMKTIDVIHLRPRSGSLQHQIGKCDVNHGVPAVVFSNGGYTGNLYHEFNDGLLPLYITAERFKGEVVFVILEFHTWWMTKYQDVVKRLTSYDLVDFNRDRRVHCFPQMIVGLRIHGELALDPSLGSTDKSIHDFQALLHQGFKGSDEGKKQQPQWPAPKEKPILVLLTRSGSRVLLNLKETVKSCQRLGFQVHILNPKRDTQLSEVYAVLNSAHAVVGVHGAALTHFLFMRPGSVFIQIVPLGLTWAAEAYYGEPARKLGLEYMEYQIAAEESSLSEEYGRENTIISNPDAVNRKGWAETKRIYLEKQNVTINQKRFCRKLEKAYSYIIWSSRRDHFLSRREGRKLKLAPTMSRSK